MDQIRFTCYNKKHKTTVRERNDEKMTKPIALSFFAGAGGLDLGIEKAGFDIVFTNEIEPTYCETLSINRSKSANIRPGDINSYTKERVFQEAGLKEYNEVDLIIGGSPCQSWSTAGKRQAYSDPRGAAMLKFADLVHDIQSKFFVLENVRGFLSAALRHRPLNQRTTEHPPLEEDEQPGSALQHLLTHFGNYHVQVKLLNAADYGTAQKRERVFIVGVRNDLYDKGVRFNYPDPTNSEKGKDGLKPWVTVRDIFQNMNVEHHTYVKYSEDRMRWMRLIPKGGGNWRDLRKYGESVVKEAMNGAYQSGGGKVGFFRRIKIDEPAPTLLTSPIQKSTNLGHPFEDRPLSIEEYLAIQGFPDGYQICGTLQQKYTQVGNAVPVRLAEALGKSIISSLEQIPVLEKVYAMD